MTILVSPDVAVLLMLSGIVPSFVAISLLYRDRHKPGVLWFLVSMGTGGTWALVFATLTVVRDPVVTLALANVFWLLVPTAAVAMFLLAYEFVFKRIASRRIVVTLFVPVVLLFVLSWINPRELIFTSAYYVDSEGYLHFPLFGGVLRLLVVQVYGYVLVFLAAGMFVGEAMRTSGVERRQAMYLLVVFAVLVGSTVIKVAGLVPVYYDPTSTVYAFSGLLFAYSINKHGLLKFVPVAREQTFEEVNDAIVVVDAGDTVVDVNRTGRELFGARILGRPVTDVLPELDGADLDGTRESLALEFDGVQRHFAVRATSIRYGRNSTGKILVMSDVSALKEREQELNLLKEIFSRVFRHNIRNDLTVINGYTDLIRERADEEVTDLADGIARKSTHLLSQAEKVRKIEQVVTEGRTVTGSLRGAVEHAISACRPLPDGAVEASVADVTVEHHPKLHLAIQELIENALAHHDDPTAATIRIYADVEEETVTLFVEDDGPGIPETEIDVLRAERETRLEHGSGIGLWLVRWIVIHSNGELIVEQTANGTRIGVRLARVDGVRSGTE